MISANERVIKDDTGAHKKVKNGTHCGDEVNINGQARFPGERD